MKTTILYIPGGNHDAHPADQVVCVRPQKWTDEQWAELVQKNRDYYCYTELREKEWDYGEG